MKKSLVIVFLILLSLSFAHADRIELKDFFDSTMVIDFNNITPGEAITDQFIDDFGVTFSDDSSIFQGNPFFEREVPSTINGSMSGVNFDLNVNTTNPITAEFTSPQNRVGMFFGSDTDLITGVTEVQIKAFLGDTLLETQIFTIEKGNDLPKGNLATVFGGISREEGIDSIEFSRLSGESDKLFFQIDDFRFESPGDSVSGPSPVPEPATILMLCAGLLGLAGFGRKKFFRK